MIRAAQLDEFRRAPNGQFLVGRAWIHFCAHARLFGIVLHGRPAREDVEALTRTLLVELEDGIAPHGSLVDARRLEGVDPGAFELLHAYVRRHHARLRGQVTRLALVRPGGVEGAVVAGFFRVLESPYPVAVFEDPIEALGWLEEPNTALIAELDAHVTEATGVHPVVAGLRALIAQRMAQLTVEGACEALRVSERTLQRRLKDARTTFQKELLAARLSETQRRMLDTDEALTAIALEVGFASLQHFSALFRKATGESPSAWRSRRRR